MVAYASSSVMELSFFLLLLTNSSIMLNWRPSSSTWEYISELALGHHTEPELVLRTEVEWELLAELVQVPVRYRLACW
jgi:hypothetical protein